MAKIWVDAPRFAFRTELELHVGRLPLMNEEESVLLQLLAPGPECNVRFRDRDARPIAYHSSHRKQGGYLFSQKDELYAKEMLQIS